MSRRLLLPLAIAFAIMTPVLAQTTPPPTQAEIKELQDQVAYLKAQNDILTQQNSLATNRFAPLQSFAGNGTTTAGTNAGEMEAAYLATISMEDVADTIHRRVQNYLEHRSPPDSGQPPGVIVLTDSDTLSFDNLTAFEAEAEGVKQAFLQALSQPSTGSCRGARQIEATFAAPLIPIAGAVLSLLQTTTTVQGVRMAGDDGMLLSALAAVAPGEYIQKDALLHPQALATNPVNVRLIELEECERIAAARPPVDPAHPTDAEKALQAIVTRSAAFRARLTTVSGNASPPLATILVQGELRRIAAPYVLRLHVVLAGGTMITRKNLWTAVGLPGLTISGGVIARFRLTENGSGRSVLGGNIICRTGEMSLRAAMRLTGGDIRCAVTASPLLAHDTSGRVVAPGYSGRARTTPVFQRPDDDQ